MKVYIVNVTYHVWANGSEDAMNALTAHLEDDDARENVERLHAVLVDIDSVKELAPSGDGASARAV